ncbi:class II glutamine amidotransferase [Anaerotruncus colihominis]|uniref:class II glutamine amidotransferase n=1 Tax=Anaerotruncus colihominis TaxID=169435 RepID=UPI001748F97D|nr:class II glutamine amidotransferase [Anaerotruncus colihominis]
MCSLFGLLDYSGYFNHREKSLILSVLSNECEVRGTDATGIAYNSSGLRIFKRPLPAHCMRYRLPPKVRYIMGHTRLATQGSQKKNRNNHPFKGTAADGEFALAHNGVIHNDAILRKRLNLPSSEIETDSFIAVQILEQQRQLHFSTLKFMAEQMEGSFTFTLLDTQDRLFIVKGDSPLCIYHFADRGFYLYASTEAILTAALNRLGMTKLYHETIPVACGDILQIDHTGRIERERFCTDRLFSCHRGHFMPSAYSFFEQSFYEDQDLEYLELLKSMASSFGYTAEDIDALLEEGFTLEEIESCFYDFE